MAKWYVTDSDNKPIKNSDGDSKQESQSNFLTHVSMLTGEHKPWDWWHNQGYRVRRGKKEGHLASYIEEKNSKKKRPSKVKRLRKSEKRKQRVAVSEKTQK